MDYLKETDGKILDNVWTIPNIISIIRILMIAPILVLFVKNTPESFFWSFVLIMFAYLTDSLDGFIARKTNQVSKLGMLLDPIGDKLISLGISLTLTLLGKFPLYFLLTIVIRDAIISSGALFAMKSEHVITLPLIWGKLSTFALGIVLALYPLNYSMVMTGRESFAKTIGFCVEYGTYIAMTLLIISLFAYSITYIKKFLKKRAAK